MITPQRTRRWSLILLGFAGVAAGSACSTPPPKAPADGGFCDSAATEGHEVVVTTVAGGNEEEHVDGTSGPGGTARFIAPTWMARDNAGNLYVTERNFSSIRKIDTAGQVTTIAGQGFSGYVDGPVATAVFWAPAGIAVDNHGNLYVADTGESNRIRMITPDGQVTTLAGNGTDCHSPPPRPPFDGTGGPMGSAYFCTPGGIAVDEAGIVYVVDRGNRAVRRIDLSGTVTSIVVDRLFQGIAVGLDGVLYVTDDSSQVFRIEANGALSALCGTTPGYSDGPVGAASCDDPRGIAVGSDGLVFITGGRNGTFDGAVRQIDPNGKVTTIAKAPHGAFADGLGGCDGTATFSWPWGIVAGPPGTLYVADTLNNRIRKITF